jgi:hypothetical protein
MKIHMVSETAFYAQGMGIHTAYIDLLKLLHDKDEVQVIVNNEGKGDVFHAHTYGLYYFLKVGVTKASVYIPYILHLIH